jgi:putative addiction module component (TIGR02574 family)
MILEAMPSVQRLNSREKRQLAVELWNKADHEEGEVIVDDATLKLLDQRLLDYEANPAKVSSWAEVKQRVFGYHGA